MPFFTRSVDSMQAQIERAKAKEKADHDKARIAEYNKYASRFNVDLKKLLKYKLRHPEEGETIEIDGVSYIGWSLGQGQVTIPSTPSRYNRSTTAISYGDLFLLSDGTVYRTAVGEVPAAILNTKPITELADYSEHLFNMFVMSDKHIREEYFMQYNIRYNIFE